MSGNSARSWMLPPERPDPLARVGVPEAGYLPGEKAAAEEQEEVHPSKAYAGLWGRKERATKVEFRLLPGKGKVEGEAVDYAWLPRVQWVPSEGKIILRSTLGVTVTICGLNLWELKEKLRQSMVTWVQEQGADPIVMRQAAEEARAEGRDLVFVKEIRIDEPKPAAGAEPPG